MNIEVLRCDHCGKAITKVRLLKSGGCGCGGKYLRPTNPSFFESFRMLLEYFIYRGEKNENSSSL